MISNNAKNVVKQVLSSGNTVGLLPATDVSGITRYIADFSDYPSVVAQSFTLTAANAGISVGSGSATPTDTDYQLRNTITSGLTGTVTSTKDVDANGNASVTFTVTLTNTSINSISISEIGFKQEIAASDTLNGTTSTSRVFLLDRSVFNTITLNGSEQAIIDYTLKSTISNSGGTVASKSITANGTYYALDDSLDGYSSVSVQVPSSATLGTKTITQNGIYNALADNYDGYSQVTVNVSGGGGIDISNIVQVIPVLSGEDPTVVEANTEWSSRFAAWKALDKDEDDAWISDTSASYPATNWLKIVLTQPIIPVMFWYTGYSDPDVVPPTSVTVINYDTDAVLFTLTPTNKYGSVMAWNGTYSGSYVSNIKVIFNQLSDSTGVSRCELWGIPAS